MRLDLHVECLKPGTSGCYLDCLYQWDPTKAVATIESVKPDCPVESQPIQRLSITIGSISHETANLY